MLKISKSRGFVPPAPLPTFMSTTSEQFTTAKI